MESVISRETIPLEMTALFSVITPDSSGPLTPFVRRACRNLALVAFLGSVASANTLELIRKIPHSGYSEGITHHDGFLWHALPKAILKINPADGEIVERLTPPTEYSESLEWFQGKLYNLSFSDDGIYVGAKGKGKLEFAKKGKTPEVHGWGITHNGKHLIVTGDYSSKLYFLDPKTLKLVKTLKTEGKDLEDLAWDGKWIWTSSFTADKGHIYKMDPDSGKILDKYSLPQPGECPVIDGIAYDGKNFWITGKECPSIYYVKYPTERAVTSKKP
jgi:glutaminyl-peptide cyclotransferase